MTPGQELELLQRASEKLGEHFDSVQIFVTRHDPPEGTINMTYGAGNWFARFGQISDWLSKSVERTREGVRKEDNE